ncbi:glutathione S-transferase [Dulcicalothrix desertica PCC 7102]|uniref:Glutathione S-transferase n=1 Tax=Dulcicalothrix desertica PCC 7102 TaxID=232991 RepID=A0A3S1CFJ9_9CYAN|nr:glutathione S-transferase family protein [Dulcicalothrix desertica]RUT00538.1 glutathione S-transferase [Dulcicalothrix desertica PCC 7102]TWH53318.1 glutathione S-transferase [Dulcicalothrix desertica PCC 7102]
MLKLYAGARSRASIVQWYLEELSVPYELVMLDMATGEHRQDAFLAINPFGKVPAIVDGDFKLWESGAILMYLAEKHAGITSVETRAVLNQWVLFGNSTLATGVFIEASREKEMPRLMTALNNMFEKQPFIMGDEFTVADVAVGSILCYIPIMLQLDLSAYPAVLDYMKRMTERDGFKKSIGAR